MKMKALSIYLSTVVGTAYGSFCSSSSSSSNETFPFSYTSPFVQFAWSTTSSLLTMEVRVDAPLSFLGIGFGNSGMTNADMVIATFNAADGTASIGDYYSKGHAPPSLDTTLGGSDDVTLLCSNVTSTKTVVRFERKLSTGDSNYDFVIPPSGEFDIIYAWSFRTSITSTPIHYHGPSNHGHSRIDLARGIPDSQFGKEMNGSAARALAKSAMVGTLATLQVDGSGFHNKEAFNAPYASVASYVLDEEGTPILLLSQLEKNIINANDDSRVSLAVHLPMGSRTFQDQEPMASCRTTYVGHLVLAIDGDDAAALKKLYVAGHPQSAMWIDFNDFGIYTLNITALYWVGGFGGEHYIGYVNVEDYYGDGGGGREEEREMEME